MKGYKLLKCKVKGCDDGILIPAREGTGKNKSIINEVTCERYLTLKEKRDLYN